MMIDVTFFGYGVGLVLLGFVVGAVIGIVKRGLETSVGPI